MSSSSFWAGLQKNLLALISISIAISALSYTSWRNELTEENRNQRAAGFEMMRETAHLQLLVDQATYSKQTEMVDPIQGWVRVNLIQSLAKLTTPQIQGKAGELKRIWNENWQLIYEQEAANVRVTDAINALNDAVNLHLQSLR